MRAWLRAELRRLASTCIWSWNGWQAAWTSEKSLRQWTLANILSAVAAFALPLAPAERALILALGLLLLAAELANTAIEAVVDFVTDESHPLAGKAKDCGSAMVAVTAIAAGVAWLVLIWGLVRGG
ncbi:MAG: diacylglycerol kinase [Rhodobacter sp.]|uniref:diacylglycerol kinase n=1 Tax=Pararhodobacter sp. TaxID=2127056 RepID=UPI001D5537C5|nr:diacylglycerol kinase [Pararhodobacter sp.]MCB1346178.1 diacylglycerol kinase [Paracoccaceae bacterium]MCC0072790.1 diacylglycerol kinase [Rhodobacter sp.]HPD92070.1 diacylglycerol kinase [Pararhodobacter sp.]